MQVTLKTPIEGYAREAEYRVPKVGEYVAFSSYVKKWSEHNSCGHAPWLVLTPEKSPADKLADAAEKIVFNTDVDIQGGYQPIRKCLLDEVTTALKEYREAKHADTDKTTR